MNEKRHFGRIPFDMEIGLDGPDGNFTGFLQDISLKGVLIRFDSLPSLSQGARTRISLELSPTVKLVFEAEAVHFHDQSIGFRFESLDTDTLTHLVRLLELNSGDAEQVERELHFLVGHV